MQFVGLFASENSAEKSSTDRQALFAELNKGELITSTLKKVTADMQTHKNPTLRGQVRKNILFFQVCLLFLSTFLFVTFRCLIFSLI